MGLTHPLILLCVAALYGHFFQNLGNQAQVIPIIANGTSICSDFWTFRGMFAHDAVHFKARISKLLRILLFSIQPPIYKWLPKSTEFDLRVI